MSFKRYTKTIAATVAALASAASMLTMPTNPASAATVISFPCLQFPVVTPAPMESRFPVSASTSAPAG